MKPWFVFWWPFMQGTLGMIVMSWAAYIKNMHLLIFGGVVTIVAELGEIRHQLREIRYQRHRTMVLEIKEKLEGRIQLDEAPIQ